MQTAIIKATRNLYNRGKCFTKGKEYEVPRRITNTAALVETMIDNDNGEPHIIGSWWRYFKIVER